MPVDIPLIDRRTPIADLPEFLSPQEFQATSGSRGPRCTTYSGVGRSHPGVSVNASGFRIRLGADRVAGPHARQHPAAVKGSWRITLEFSATSASRSPSASTSTICRASRRMPPEGSDRCSMAAERQKTITRSRNGPLTARAPPSRVIPSKADSRAFVVACRSEA